MKSEFISHIHLDQLFSVVDLLFEKHETRHLSYKVFAYSYHSQLGCLFNFWIIHREVHYLLIVNNGCHLRSSHKWFLVLYGKEVPFLRLKFSN
jgi:hypothetical protein